MKYFLKELWCNLHHSDPAVRQNASLQWDQNVQRYQEYFKTIQHQIPKRFRTAWLQHHGFHDYGIKSISFSEKKGVTTCILELLDSNRSVFLQLIGVQSVHVDIPSFGNCLIGGLSWGYGEFELLRDGMLKLSVLCDMECELNFTFNKISIAQ